MLLYTKIKLFIFLLEIKTKTLADVAQSVERGPSKSNVARSNRVIRLKYYFNKSKRLVTKFFISV